MRGRGRKGKVFFSYNFVIFVSFVVNPVCDC
jgi:hypothetical protein